jgi:hypothetical protein
MHGTSEYFARSAIRLSSRCKALGKHGVLSRLVIVNKSFLFFYVRCTPYSVLYGVQSKDLFLRTEYSGHQSSIHLPLAHVCSIARVRFFEWEIKLDRT